MWQKFVFPFLFFSPSFFLFSFFRAICLGGESEYSSIGFSNLKNSSPCPPKCQLQKALLRLSIHKKWYKHKTGTILNYSNLYYVLVTIKRIDYYSYGFNFKMEDDTIIQQRTLYMRWKFETSQANDQNHHIVPDQMRILWLVIP